MIAHVTNPRCCFWLVCAVDELSIVRREAVASGVMSIKGQHLSSLPDSLLSDTKLHGAVHTINASHNAIMKLPASLARFQGLQVCAASCQCLPLSTALTDCFCRYAVPAHQQQRQASRAPRSPWTSVLSYLAGTPMCSNGARCRQVLVWRPVCLVMPLNSRPTHETICARIRILATLPSPLSDSLASLSLSNNRLKVYSTTLSPSIYHDPRALTRLLPGARLCLTASPC